MLVNVPCGPRRGPGDHWIYSAPFAGLARHAARPGGAPSSPSSACCRCSSASSRAPRRLDRHTGPRVVRRRRAPVRSFAGSGRRAPDAADRVLRRSTLQRQRGDHVVVLRDVRLVLPVLALPAVRARLLATGGRPRHAPAAPDVHHPVAAQRGHRRPVRHRPHDGRGFLLAAAWASPLLVSSGRQAVPGARQAFVLMGPPAWR